MQNVSMAPFDSFEYDNYLNKEIEVDLLWTSLLKEWM